MAIHDGGDSAAPNCMTGLVKVRVLGLIGQALLPYVFSLAAPFTNYQYNNRYAKYQRKGY